MEPTSDRSKRRAAQTVRCLPLNSSFYEDVQKMGLDAEEVYAKDQKYRVKGMKWFRNPNHIEMALIWLIKVGALRREVDGQGLTSKIRLTPLGRHLLEDTPNLPCQKAGILEHINNWISSNWPR